MGLSTLSLSLSILTLGTLSIYHIHSRRTHANIEELVASVIAETIDRPFWCQFFISILIVYPLIQIFINLGSALNSRSVQGVYLCSRSVLQTILRCTFFFHFFYFHFLICAHCLYIYMQAYRHTHITANNNNNSTQFKQTTCRIFL